MHLLVGNPTAQSGRNAARIELARDELRAHGLVHELLPTRPNGETVAVVADALRSGRYTTVIAMGGDGTFAEVAKGLLASGQPVPLAMLPTGTANDQGRSFGMDSREEDLPRNVAVVADGHTVPLDAGRIRAFGAVGDLLGQDWFFDSAGWGFSAQVLRMRNEDRRLVGGVPILRDVYRDHAVYAGAVLRAFALSTVQETPFEAEVHTPAGRVWLEDLTDLIVKNTRIYAGAWVLDETASPEDGEMELVPFRGREELLARGIVHHELVPLRGDHLEAVGLRLSEPLRAPWFDVHIHARPLAAAIEAQLDGEEWVRAERYRIDVQRHALRLVVPRELDEPEP